MRKLIVLLILLATAGLTSCSSNLFSVHKIDIQQGNAVTQESVDQLKVGMKAEQVRYLLGHPLINDIFRPDRWDYVYYFKPGVGQLEKKRITVFFNNNRVVRIDQPGATQLAKR